MTHSFRGARARAGLTLMELIVVLVILIALASIVVPLLPNMITRAHTTSAATNIQEIAKSVATYEQLYFGFPDGWDSLTVGNALATYVPNPSVSFNGANTTFLTTQTLAASDPLVATLTSSGIQNVYNFVATPNDATFYPYGTDMSIVPTATNLSASGATLVKLTPDGARKLNLDPTATYFVLGYGKKNTMVGKVAVDAPVHFPDGADSPPQLVYGRFGVVFKASTGVNNAAATDSPLPRAVLVSIVDFNLEEGISTLCDHMCEYYQTVNASK